MSFVLFGAKHVLFGAKHVLFGAKYVLFGQFTKKETFVLNMHFTRKKYAATFYHEN